MTTSMTNTPVIVMTTRQRGEGEPITGDAALAPLRKHRHPRLARICFELPEVTADSATGQHIAFRVRGKTFAYYLDNHHNDGRVAVWLPVPPGMQPMMIEASPEKFFKPPYVGVRGWVGIELAQIDEEELTFHLHTAYRQIAPKKLRLRLEITGDQ